MRPKTGAITTLVLTLGAALSAGAQEQTNPPSARAEDAPAGNAAPALPPPGTPASPAGLSPWLTYSRPDCCGPVGGNGPITYDLYARTGLTFPLGSGPIADSLQTGWAIEGGGRTLFFNTFWDVAWDVDLGLSYQYNHANHPDITFPLILPDFTTTPTSFTPQQVYVGALHRTFVNFSLGQEYYLFKPAGACGPNLRVGWDLGGRYGTARLEVYRAAAPHNYVRRQDVIEGLFTAIHSDVEFGSCGCCTFLAGLRLEWAHTWMDVAPHSNVQDVNLLGTFGVRF